jgi:hypothetical protein
MPTIAADYERQVDFLAEERQLSGLTLVVVSVAGRFSIISPAKTRSSKLGKI